MMKMIIYSIMYRLILASWSVHKMGVIILMNVAVSMLKIHSSNDQILCISILVKNSFECAIVFIGINLFIKNNKSEK